MVRSTRVFTSSPVRRVVVVVVSRDLSPQSSHHSTLLGVLAQATYVSRHTQPQHTHTRMYLVNIKFVQIRMRAQTE